jgi:hypothetical protein
MISGQQLPQQPLSFPAVQAGTLCCVWTSHPDHQRDCRVRILAAVVTGAWRSELRGRRMPEGFFRFLWEGGEWLGYGLPDGRVRGVYCPKHCAMRDARTPRAQRLAEEREREERLMLVG